LQLPICLAEVYLSPFSNFLYFFIAPEDFIAARDGIIPIDIFMHGSSNEMEIFGVAWLAGICLSRGRGIRLMGSTCKCL